MIAALVYVGYPLVGLIVACVVLRTSLARLTGDESVIPDAYVTSVALAWSAGVFWPIVLGVAVPAWLIAKWDNRGGVRA